eukprot:TRINITY_DN422_c0_g1_i2.p1 TRINITY_DN422_c0_g1~~TRINITY_DN422_c0_g1_i2.p1  ORF type:complete len:561 (+),score=273.12 TRINITY_DN422_c0_g1_i2:58-1740(+)
MPIPLPIRKAIRDTEPKMKESLEKLQESTGKEFTVEIDWEKNLAAVDESNRANLPSTYQDSVIENVVVNIVEMCKTETTKEAFLEASSSNKIVINVNTNPKADKYWDIKFENGDIVISHKKELYNVSDVRWFDLKAVIPSPGGLSLVQRLNLEQNKEKMDEHLEKLAEATGANDWSIDVDFEKIVKEISPSNVNQIGDIFYNNALENIVCNIIEAVKNETIKESFNEATSQHKIVFQVNNDKKFDKYWDVKFENGNVVVDFKKDLYNQSDLKWVNLSEKIPSPGGLSLVQRLNLEKAKEKYDELLEKLQSITGADWTVEADFDKLVKELAPNNANQIGDIFHNNALENLVSNIEELCKQETSKEAFLEATSERKIVFRVNNDKKFDKYWAIKFENGNLVVDFKKELYNQSDLRWFKMESVMPVPGVISLLGKLNLEENRETLNEALEKMKTVSGEEYTFDEACVEEFYKSVDPNNKDQVGSLVKGIVINFVDNCEERLKDEMVKEAFLEITNARQITLKCNNKQSPYWDIKFDNGVIVISYKKELYNQSDVRWFDFEKLL